MNYQVRYTYYQYLFTQHIEMTAQHAFSLSDRNSSCKLNLFYKPVKKGSVKVFSENGYDISNLFNIVLDNFVDVVTLTKKCKFAYNKIFSLLKGNKNMLCL